MRHYADLVPQTSGDLTAWEPVDPAQILKLPDGTRQANFDLVEGEPFFFRIAAVRG